MERNFGGVVWTNHVLDRMRERGIKQGDAWATWRNPQTSKKGTVAGSWVYYRNYAGTQIEVVAKQNEKREWIILSVWSRSVFQANTNKKSNLWSNLIKLLLK